MPTYIPRPFFAAVLGAAALTSGTAIPQASANEWRFERTRGGGFADTCENFRRDRICAVVYCAADERGLSIGLTGWEPRGQGKTRRGPVRIDGNSEEVRFTEVVDPIVGRVWQVDTMGGGRRMIERIKQGYDLAVDLRARGPAFRFSLDNSFNAISDLERRCQRTDRSQQALDATDRGARRQQQQNTSDNFIRFGTDDFGIDVRLSSEDSDNDGVRRVPIRDTAKGAGRGNGTAADNNWVKIDEQQVNRRRDRDIINLGRGAGRYEALQLKAIGNDVRVRRVKVTYGNGVTQALDVDRRLREGDDNNIIELRGKRARYLDRVTLVYATAGRGPKAQMQVWGRKANLTR